MTAVSVGRDCGIILPEQDVIAVQCVETPVPNIYYTYADVSPITSSISSPVVSLMKSNVFIPYLRYLLAVLQKTL